MSEQRRYTIPLYPVMVEAAAYDALRSELDAALAERDALKAENAAAKSEAMLHAHLVERGFDNELDALRAELAEERSKAERLHALAGAAERYMQAEHDDEVGSLAAQLEMSEASTRLTDADRAWLAAAHDARRQPAKEGEANV